MGIQRAGRATALARMASLALFAGVSSGPSVQAASLDVSCIRGCLRDGDESVNLLKRPALDAPITLRWLTSEPPAPEGSSVILFAGNPKRDNTLKELGPLEFTQEGRRYFATQSFEGETLGKGTFLTVLVLRDGRKETLLDWRSWRLLTEGDQAGAAEGVAAPTGWELNLSAAALRADTSRGSLPRSQGGDASSWWSLWKAQDQLDNLELDGDSNGIPGLGVQISAPWQARTSEDKPLVGLADALKGVDGHEVHFEDLAWTEKPDQAVSLEREAASLKLMLRHYYSVVTVWTHATVKAFSKKEVSGFFGIFDRTFFAHETSVHLKQPKDPRFWASYDVREFGSDPHLLELLRHQVADGKSVPGLPELQQQDGDGGLTTYHLAIQAKASPWLESEGEAKAAVGIVSVEVVASRAGYGRVLTQGGAGGSALDRAWAKVAGPDGNARGLNLDDPPEGFYTAAVTAQASTRSGVLPVLRDPLQLAQRGISMSEEVRLEPDANGAAAADTSNKMAGSGGTESLKSLLSALKGSSTSPKELFEKIGMPDTVTFPLSATLRSGALVEGRPGDTATNLQPVDAYAQYVVKLTVAMLPETTLVTTQEAVISEKKEQDVLTTIDKKPVLPLPEVSSGRMMVYAIVIGLVALVVLVFAVPGLRTFLSGWLKFLTPRDRK